MAHKIKKSKQKTVGNYGKHKVSYNISDEIEKTKVAYADSFTARTDYPDDPKDRPKWEEKVYKKRKLKWKGTKFLKPTDFHKVAKIVGEYNYFDPEKVSLILRNYPKAKIKLAREGSVAVYIKPEGENISKLKRDLRVLGDADEIGLVKAVPSKFVEEEGGKVLRVWWD